MFAHLFLCLTVASANPTWSIEDSGVTTSIRGIGAVDAQVCWYGTKSGVARTTDGGKTW